VPASRQSVMAAAAGVGICSASGVTTGM